MINVYVYVTVIFKEEKVKNLGGTGESDMRSRREGRNEVIIF